MNVSRKSGLVLVEQLLAVSFLAGLASGPRLTPADGWDAERTVRNHGLLRGAHHFAVVCHRGNHVDAPENTMDAFREAIRIDADYFETDLRTTKDGLIVLMHDQTVDRTTDGHGPVRNLTTDEIRALKIKRARHDEEKVPTFEEALDLARNHINIYMDIKDVTPEQVMPLLKKYHMEKNVIAYVYSGEQVDDWRSKAPSIPVIADVDLKTVDQAEADWRAHPFAISDGNALNYKPGFVTMLHRLKVIIWPDIQNPGEQPSQWQPFIDMGVDGFQSDHPEALINHLKQKGIR